MPPTDRRAFLHSLGAAALAAGLDRAGVGRLPRPAATLDRIGLQLYTVRSALERDFEGALDRVAAIGYRGVEVAGYFGKTPHGASAAASPTTCSSPRRTPSSWRSSWTSIGSRKAAANRSPISPATPAASTWCT